MSATIAPTNENAVEQISTSLGGVMWKCINNAPNKLTSKIIKSTYLLSRFSASVVRIHQAERKKHIQSFSTHIAIENPSRIFIPIYVLFRALHSRHRCSTVNPEVAWHLYRTNNVFLLVKQSHCVVFSIICWNFSNKQNCKPDNQPNEWEQE